MNPEPVYLAAERSYLTSQLSILYGCLAISNKLDRSSGDATAIRNYCGDETSILNNEIQLLNSEVLATSRLKLEPSMTGYSDNSNADYTHRRFLSDSLYALAYDQSIITNYQGHNTPEQWVLNLHAADTTVVRGKYLGVGVPYNTGTGVTSIVGQTYFAIKTDPSNNRKILSDASTIDGTYFPPSVLYQDTSTAVSGFYTGFTSNGYSASNQITFYLTSVPLFFLRYVPTTFTLEVVPANYLGLTWGSYYTSYSFFDYPTIADLRTALNNVPGLNATSNPSFDTSSTNELIAFGPSPLAPTVILTDSSLNTLLTVVNDSLYNFQYTIDKSGLDIIWDSSHKYYSYDNYSTILAMKSSINYDIPGLDATGNSMYDTSTSRGLKIDTTVAIPPDGVIYSGLRECIVDFWTIDDKNLTDRSDFDSTRIGLINSRLAYLPVRQTQIKNALANEEYLMSLDGSTGNLYDWADNRFNRSVGCEARLKQIEKMAQMNWSSLRVNSRFL
jgi:hypothetical protein